MSIEKLSDVSGTTDPVPYAQIANQCLQSVRNPDALAIWCYLQSLPSDWTLRRAHMMEHFDIGRDRYAKALRDLCEAGLISYEVIQGEDGRMLGKRVRVHRLPTVRVSDMSVDRQDGKPDTYKENMATKEIESTKETPASPAELKKRRQSKSRKQELTLTEWVKSQPKGVELIGPEHPARVFAAQAGLPDAWVALAWKAFTDKHLTSGKRYKDWGLAFRNAVAGNWERVWFVDKDGTWKLTTVGYGLDRVMNGGAQ